MTLKRPYQLLAITRKKNGKHKSKEKAVAYPVATRCAYLPGKVQIMEDIYVSGRDYLRSSMKVKDSLEYQSIVQLPTLSSVPTERNYVLCFFVYSLSVQGIL